MTPIPGRAVAACLALLAAAAACGPRAVPPAAAPPPSRQAADLDLPAGFTPLSVEFGDARRGTALFTRCGTVCEARLFHTGDGGRSWQPRRHPRPEADNHQLYAGAGAVVVLLAEPHSWYVSRDGGTTWQPRPYDSHGAAPVEYHSAGGRYYLDCPREGGSCAVRDWTAPGPGRAVPAGLPAAGALTNGPGGRTWLSGVEGGRPVVAVGRDGGGFTRQEVPAQPGRPVWNARVSVSADGADVWLVADQKPAGGGGGGVLPGRALARKGTGLPLLWRYEGDAWVPHPVTGVEEKPGQPYSVAPAGGGVLVLAGAERTGYLTAGAYSPAPGAPALQWVGQLPDGTVFGRDDEPGVNHFSAGTGAARTWSTVEVSP